VVIEPGAIDTPMNSKQQSAVMTKAIGQNCSEIWLSACLDAQKSYEKMTQNFALPSSVVARAIFDALFLKNPRARYIVAKGGSFVELVLLLPEWIKDKIFTPK